MKRHSLPTIALLLLMLATASCTGSRHNSDLFYEDEQGVTHIEIEKIIDNDDLKREQFHLSEIAESISYIKLESVDADGEEKFLRRIAYFIFTNDNIIASDFTTALLFDKEGKLIHQLGRRGQGPGEYLYINGLAVDEKNKKIYMGEETKILVYDFNNKFIHSFPMKEEINRMQFIGDGKLLLNHINTYGTLKNKLSLTDSIGNMLKSYPNCYKFTLQGNTVIGIYPNNMTNNFYATQKGVLYKQEYNDSIYSFDKDYNLQPAILLHLGKYNVPLHLRPQYLCSEEKLNKQDYNCYNTFTTKTDKYFIVECRTPWGDPKLKLVICNRENSECIYTEQAIVNDIDHGMDIKPSGITPDGKYLYAWTSCSYFIEQISKKENASPSLKKFADGVTDDDNLVLMMIKLK